jgi:hypothetical protein
MMPRSTLRPILERLAYAGYLATLVGSITGTWLGWLTGLSTGDFAPLLAALCGLALARWLHVQGHAHWHFQECSASLDKIGTEEGRASPRPEKTPGAEVAELFAQLEVEDDVWARGALRREIEAKLAAAPALREEFAEALAEHPEI